MDQQQQQNNPEHSPSSTGGHPQATDAQLDASATGGVTDRAQVVAVTMTAPMAAPMAAPMMVPYPAYAPLGGHQHEEPFLHGRNPALPGTVGVMDFNSAMDLDPVGFVAGAGWQTPGVGLQYSNVDHEVEETAPSLNVFEYFPYDEAHAQRTQNQELSTLRFDRAFMPSEPPPGYLYHWNSGSDAPSSAYDTAMATAVGTPVASPVATTVVSPVHEPQYRPEPAAALPTSAHAHPALVHPILVHPTPPMPPVPPMPPMQPMPPPMPGLNRAATSSTSSVSETPRSSSSSGGLLPPMYGNPTNAVAANTGGVGAGGTPGRRSTKQTTRRAKTMPHRRSSAGTTGRSNLPKSASPMSPSPLASSSSEGSKSLPATASLSSITPALAPAAAAGPSGSSSSGSVIPHPLQEAEAGKGPSGEEKRGRSSHNLVEKQYRSRLNDQFKGLMNSLPRGISPLVGSEGTGVGEGDTATTAYRGDMADSKHHSKAEVLEMARIHIQALEQERDTLVRERDALLRNVQVLQGGYGVPFPSPMAPRQETERTVGRIDEEEDDDDDDVGTADADGDADAGAG